MPNQTLDPPSNYKTLILILAVLALFACVALWIEFGIVNKSPTYYEIQESTDSMNVRAKIRASARVTIDALPKARVKLVPKGFSIAPIPDSELITPCHLILPEGEYAVEVTNETNTQRIQASITVDSKKTNSFVFTLPGYEPKK